MRCFVIRGFGKKTDSSGRQIDFDQVHKNLIAPALKACGLDGGTTIEFVDSGSIHKDMFVRIVKAEIVVCDITVHNANVFYELGVRHALRRRHTVLIKGEPSADGTPFDIVGLRYLSYDIAKPEGAKDALVAALSATMRSNRSTDSPVFMTMPELPETDVRRIVEIPPGVVEAVQRAEVGEDKAALAQLAEQARGQVYEREVFKAVGQAQWTLNDVDAAVTTWEAVAQNGQDLDTNLALANLYERQYKRSMSVERLELSTQASQRVLDEGGLEPAIRAEALALKARNLKTLWRQAFDQLDSEAERRERAIDRRAKDCYEAYLAAHRADLNHFFSGVTALQMGCILQSLSAHARFVNLFDGNAGKARRYVEDLDEQLGQVAPVVGAAIERGIAAATGEAIVWARISAADLLFLVRARAGAGETDHSAVVQAYRDAIPAQRGFYWDSARRQLALFESLGIGTEVARAVMQDFDPPRPV